MLITKTLERTNRERHVAPGFLNALLWIVALSPFESLFVFLLAPIFDSIPTLAIVYFYAPGMYLMKPLFDAIPYLGWMLSLIHLALAMTIQNLAIWAAFAWWQTHRRQALSPCANGRNADRVP